MKENRCWTWMHTLMLKALVLLVVVTALACKVTGKTPAELREDGLVESVQESLNHKAASTAEQLVDRMFAGF